MNEAVFDRVVTMPAALREVFVAAYAHAQSLMMNGERVHVTIQEALDPIQALQRSFLHGPVLGQISEQAFVGEKRERFTADIWKVYFFRRFIKPKYKMRKLPGNKKATPVNVLTSSEQLGVRRYSQWIDEIIDHAVAEFNVGFEFNHGDREGVRYLNKPKPGRTN